MSVWQKFYYSWGGFGVALGLTLLIMLVVPLAIPYAAAFLLPMMLLFALYGVFFVHCPKCGVRLSETVLAHGLPREQCPMCLCDLKAQPLRSR